MLRYAQNVREKFGRDADPADLLLDAESLKQQADRLRSMLPAELQNRTNLGRHIAFMIHWLKRDNVRSCRGDIDDICDQDLPELEREFLEWCGSPENYDEELVGAISELLAQAEFDSAVRKAFVVLKERLCTKFKQSKALDGPELVNRIFGTKASLRTSLNETQRQAYRDLLAGLYGVYRNRFAHNYEVPTFSEVDAVVSLVNQLLIDIGTIRVKRDRG